jgi:hypothetical protein
MISLGHTEEIEEIFCGDRVAGGCQSRRTALVVGEGATDLRFFTKSARLLSGASFRFISRRTVIAMVIKPFERVVQCVDCVRLDGIASNSGATDGLR